MDENAPDSDVQALIEFLRDRDAWCPACRYNLRGLTTPRCPECGRELRLSVGVTEPFLRAWIMLAVSTCASSALGVLMAWILFREGWPGGTEERSLKVSIVIYIVMIPLGPLVLVTRRRFLRMTKDVQWRIAGFVAIVSVAAFVLLLSSVN
jgi:hypothetical protein